MSHNWVSPSSDEMEMEMEMKKKLPNGKKEVYACVLTFLGIK